MAAVASILFILLNLAVITIVISAVIEVGLRLTRRGTFGRGTWLSLLGGTGIVLLAVLSLTLPA